MKELVKKTTTTELDRREFNARTILALLSGVTVTVAACSDSPTSPEPPSPSPPGNVSGAVAANHGHTAQITAAELEDGGAVTLDIEGTADHPHSVQLTTQEVMRIADGERVSKQSSTDAGHSHLVTFN